MGKKLLDTKNLFVLFGMINVMLILILLTLLILIFNDIYILSRTGFVIFVGIHLFLLFFVKIHFLRIDYDDERQKIEFHYTKRFGFRWLQNSKTVLLPLSQFDGYKLGKDTMGMITITFYKLEKKEKYELGPFHIGFLTKKQRKNLEDAFGESL